MDSLKLPIREIEATYTISELVIMSWHAKLQAYNMSKRFDHNKKLQPVTSAESKVVTIESGKAQKNPNNIQETDSSYILPSSINNGVPIPKKFFNSEGEMDLRLASGIEAATYLRKIGIQLTVPLMP